MPLSDSEFKDTELTIGCIFVKEIRSEGPGGTEPNAPLTCAVTAVPWVHPGQQ